MKVLHSRILGNGRPLIILHGFLGMSDNWKSLGMQFAEAGFQVHLIDQRNHGHSFWADRFDYPTLADDLLSYMDHHRIIRAALLGHSMGGKTAMLFACMYPERVDHLLVADIAPKYYPPHHKYILDALSALPAGSLTSRTQADELLSQSIRDWGIRQFLLKNLYWVKPGQLGFRMNLPVLSQSMEAIGAPLPSGARYDGPVLFLRGGKSPYIADEDLSDIRTHFPRAGLETLPGAGHWLHAEKPEEFYQLSLEFMDS
jgi:pimeloyl-ACP methyl ester carboxylesterase